VPEGWASDEDDPESEEDDEEDLVPGVADIWRSKTEDLGDTTTRP
jgi:hypothetical protein